MDATLILVTGAGRSGTSTAAGALHHLGLSVPGPHLAANESNPRGFFESAWTVRFHNRVLKHAVVATADVRPEARALAHAVAGPRRRARLAQWLAEVTAGAPVSVVKDPRATWLLPLWARACSDADLRLTHLVMVRHPAEVVGSRGTHYASGSEKLGAQRYARRNLAGWINAMLVTEQDTAARPRAFVNYDDLLADWRTTLSRAADALGVTLPEDPTAAAAVDAFVDPGLQRHQSRFTDLDHLALPDALVSLAEEVYAGCAALAEGRSGDLAPLREQYAALAPTLDL
ncbi:MAG: sulfotransferase [Nocardioides sp.]|nr:sulfotransferase [Nocardioides sp.]